jgi:hypothetical protein
MIDTLQQQLQAALPNAQTRITSLVIVLFMLAVLSALLYFKKEEADEATKSAKNPPD